MRTFFAIIGLTALLPISIPFMVGELIGGSGKRRRRGSGIMGSIQRAQAGARERNRRADRAKAGGGQRRYREVSVTLRPGESANEVFARLAEKDARPRSRRE